MDAIEFIRERNRMCATYTPKRCEGCPADNYGGCGVTCIMIDKVDAEKLVPIVEKWSSEHPRKTRQSVFLEQYPDAFIASNGILHICPANISSNYRGEGEHACESCTLDDYNSSCLECRRKFWMEEVE